MPTSLEKMSEYNKKRNARIRKLVFDHYGHECVCCGETEDKLLTIDHIVPIGGKRRRKTESGKLYQYLVQNHFPEGFQVLCMGCNWAKSRYGICPHQEVTVSNPTRRPRWVKFFIKKGTTDQELQEIIKSLQKLPGVRPYWASPFNEKIETGLIIIKEDGRKIRIEDLNKLEPESNTKRQDSNKK